MHTLYRFYSADDTLLYIGMTINPGRRMERHREKPWWPDVASIVLEKQEDLSALRAAERTAIETEWPVHNIRMSRRPHLNADEREILAEGCGEWIDDKEDWCGAAATHHAAGAGGGIFVCDNHTYHYSLTTRIAA